MTVAAEKLVRMAEQIAANVAIGGDEDAIADRVAGHLIKFWDPRMRAEICQYAVSHPAALSPVVAKAVGRLE